VGGEKIDIQKNPTSEGNGLIQSGKKSLKIKKVLGEWETEEGNEQSAVLHGKLKARRTPRGGGQMVAHGGEVGESVSVLFGERKGKMHLQPLFLRCNESRRKKRPKINWTRHHCMAMGGEGPIKKSYYRTNRGCLGSKNIVHELGKLQKQQAKRLERETDQGTVLGGGKWRCPSFGGSSRGGGKSGSLG